MSGEIDALARRTNHLQHRGEDFRSIARNLQPVAFPARAWVSASTKATNSLLPAAGGSGASSPLPAAHWIGQRNAQIPGRGETSDHHRPPDRRGLVYKLSFSSLKVHAASVMLREGCSGCTRAVRPIAHSAATHRPPERDTPPTRARHTAHQSATRRNGGRRGSAEEGMPAPDEQTVQGLLDGLAYLVGEVEDQCRIVGGTRFVGISAHRLRELDVPLGR
jgi:hypothetical protein